MPESDEMKAFYALGVNIAKQVGGEVKRILSPEEINSLVAGFGDSMLDQVADERTLLMTYASKLNKVLTERSAEILTSEKKKGADYVVKHLLTSSRAVQTPSGLIFDEIIAGVGPKPSASSTVTVHYHGTLVDGTVFDSSVERGEPISFPLSNVIKGWQEGVAMMNVGSKAKLIIPSDLAYGDAGTAPAIPGGATLIFEVELISIA